jgi:endo-beta-N-acetylglucosaminidase D
MSAQLATTTETVHWRPAAAPPPSEKRVLIQPVGIPAETVTGYRIGRHWFRDDLLVCEYAAHEEHRTNRAKVVARSKEHPEYRLTHKRIGFRVAGWANIPKGI